MDCTLSGRQTVAVARHLRSCKACQLELESLRRAKALLRFYAAPRPPAAYHHRFWRQLQTRIESHPRPLWRRTSLLRHLLAWEIRENLNQLAEALRKQLIASTSWLRASPVYAWVAFTVFVSVFANQFLQPRQPNPLHSQSFRHALSEVYPVWPVKLQGNRELISNRERPVGVARSVQEQLVYENHKLESSPLRRGTIGGYAPEASTDILRWRDPISGLIDDHETLNAVANRYSPELIMAVQLSNPGAIASEEEDFQPMGGVTLPSTAPIGRGSNRSRNGFAAMLTPAPPQSFSIPEVDDAVKL
jgi:hypothetical protein